VEKRYQVFVSSTYEDLIEERQEVMHALLELDCIPSGMELFPANDDDQWTAIKRVIDDCDYYMVIIGGRYGSSGPSGRSYTQMEYEYAVERGKPVMAFLHKDPPSLPASKSEVSPAARKKLKEFTDLVRKRVCKTWTTPSDLGSVVSRSLVRLIKTNPAVGWVKADRLPTEDAAEEILRLQKVVHQMEEQLESARTKPPSGTEGLAQRDAEFTLRYKYSYDDPDGARWTTEDELDVTWNAIFAALGPALINEASEARIRTILDQLIGPNERQRAKSEVQGDVDWKSFHVHPDDFDTIKIQLRALGLMTQSHRKRHVGDAETYWTLTPYGDTVLTQLRAIRGEAAEAQV